MFGLGGSPTVFPIELNPNMTSWRTSSIMNLDDSMTMAVGGHHRNM